MSFYRSAAWAGCLAAALLILTPMTASGTVSGGCTVTGSAPSSGTVNLTTADKWHLKTTDEVNGSATYPSQTFVHIYAYLFGLPVPVYNSSGRDTHGSAGPFLVSDYSRFSRVFAAGGSSDTCSGTVLIVVDDQSAFTNLIGLAALILAAIGLIGLLLLMFAGSGSGGCASTFLGAVAGLLFGLGVGLVAIETGLLDPRSLVGLVIVGAAVVVGLAIPIARSRMA